MQIRVSWLPRYREGNFESAIILWEIVLAATPDNEKAQRFLKPARAKIKAKEK